MDLNHLPIVPRLNLCQESQGLLDRMVLVNQTSSNRFAGLWVNNLPKDCVVTKCLTSSLAERHNARHLTVRKCRLHSTTPTIIWIQNILKFELPVRSTEMVIHVTKLTVRQYAWRISMSCSWILDWDAKVSQSFRRAVWKAFLVLSLKIDERLSKMLQVFINTSKTKIRLKKS